MKSKGVMMREDGSPSKSQGVNKKAVVGFTVLLFVIFGGCSYLTFHDFNPGRDLGLAPNEFVYSLAKDAVRDPAFDFHPASDGFIISGWNGKTFGHHVYVASIYNLSVVFRGDGKDFNSFVADGLVGDAKTDENLSADSVTILVAQGHDDSFTKFRSARSQAWKHRADFFAKNHSK